MTITADIKSIFDCTSVSRLEDENDEKLGEGISVDDCSSTGAARAAAWELFVALSLMLMFPSPSGHPFGVSITWKIKSSWQLSESTRNRLWIIESSVHSFIWILLITTKITWTIKNILAQFLTSIRGISCPDIEGKQDFQQDLSNYAYIVFAKHFVGFSEQEFNRPKSEKIAKKLDWYYIYHFKTQIFSSSFIESKIWDRLVRDFTYLYHWATSIENLFDIKKSNLSIPIWPMISEAKINNHFLTTSEILYSNQFKIISSAKIKFIQAFN